MSEVRWLENARKYVGLKETAGPHHNAQILEFLDEADGKVDGKNLSGIRDDETPWCATFVSAVFEEVSIQSMRSAWARSYMKFGRSLSGPAVGCVVVFERGPTSGHVGFVVGRDKNNNILVLGGNQGDMVKISAFPTSRVLGYRWPNGQELPKAVGLKSLPIGGAPVSKSEA